MNKPESNLAPANPPALRSHLVTASKMPWQPTQFAGIEMKILYSDDEGRSTILFKMAPGAVVPLHEHTALEQTYMLEGSLEDAEGRVRRRRLRVAAGRQHPCRACAQRGDVPRGLQPAEPVLRRHEVFHVERVAREKQAGMKYCVTLLFLIGFPIAGHAEAPQSDAARKWGLIGVWAINCDAPAEQGKSLLHLRER